VSRTAVGGLLIALAASAIAVGASGQRLAPGVLRLTPVEGYTLVGPWTWVAPDGTRSQICRDTIDGEHPTACYLESWQMGAGTYHLDGELERDGALAPQSFSVDLEGDEVAIDVSVSRRHASVNVLLPAPSWLHIERAPADMRSDVCRYVVRNASESRHRATDVAWVAAPTLRDDDWPSHRGPVIWLEPRERHCVQIRPATDEATARVSRLVAYVPLMIASSREYTFTLSRSMRLVWW